MILPASYSNGFAPRDGSPLYPSLWKGCVGAWAPCLGPTGLTLRDWSGFGGHGALTNFTAATAYAVSGGKQSLYWDGTNGQYVNVSIAGTKFSFGKAALSLSMWANVVSVSGVFPFQIIKSDYIAGGSTVNYALGINNGQIRFLQCATELNVSHTVNTGWHHYCGTSDGATMRLYLDGVQVASGASPASANTEQPYLILGGLRPGGDAWIGYEDDPRVYARTLSPNEIRLLASRRGIAYELAPRRRSRAAVITSGFSALRPSILRGSR